MKITTKIAQLWWVWLLLAGAATYALAMWVSIGQSVWFDEGYSIMLAQQPVGDLLALTAVDAHPPFYYLLLKGWAGVFGWSEFALRSLSAVAAGLGVIGVGLILRKLFSTRVALAVLPFLVFAPFALRYGYEIRMYAIVALIAIAATLVLLYAVKQNRLWQWITYAALVALGMYTLYMVVVVWVAHVVWLVVRSHKAKQPMLQWRWPLAYIGAVILYLPYISTFFYQMTNSALPGIGGPVTMTTLVNMLTMYGLYTPEWQMGAYLSLLLLALIVGVVYLFVSMRRKLPSQYKTGLLFLITIVGVAMAVFVATSLPPRDPIFILRYTAHIALFCYGLVGVIVVLAWKYGNKRVATIIAVGLLFVAVLGVFQLQKTGNLVFERLQHPQTAQIRENITCDDSTTIVADDPYTYIDSVFYFKDCDLKFYSATPIEKKGGYAPLHDSTQRIDSDTQITTPKLIHLYWNNGNETFIPPANFTLKETRVYDKQVVSEYVLTEE